MPTAVILCLSLPCETPPPPPPPPRYSTEKITAEQAQELLGQLEADVDGMFNYVEYVNMMLDSK